jgi:hypothetical protein
MYKIIASSLFLHKKCTLPGIGTLIIVSRSAETDFLNTRIQSPSQSIEFISSGKENVFSTEFLAISQFIRKKLAEERILLLNGIGTFTQFDEGKYDFFPITIDPVFIPDAEAVRVIRQEELHEIAEAEQPIVNTELPEYFNEKISLIDLWWFRAIVLAVIGFLIMLIYFYQRGINLFGNIGS